MLNHYRKNILNVWSSVESPGIAEGLHWVTYLLDYFSKEAIVTQYTPGCLAKWLSEKTLWTRGLAWNLQASLTNRLSNMLAKSFWRRKSWRFFSSYSLFVELGLSNSRFLAVDFWVFVVVNDIVDRLWILQTFMHFFEFFVPDVEKLPIWIEDEQCPATWQILIYAFGLRFSSRCVWRNAEILCSRKDWRKEITLNYFSW